MIIVVIRIKQPGRLLSFNFILIPWFGKVCRVKVDNYQLLHIYGRVGKYFFSVCGQAVMLLRMNYLIIIAILLAAACSPAGNDTTTVTAVEPGPIGGNPFRPFDL
jgi:hypothetical protein